MTCPWVTTCSNILAGLWWEDKRSSEKHPRLEKSSHLDTISLTEGKHLRHSSQHTGLQRSEVMMTNEWPRSPKRPREEPLESFSRGTGDIFSSPAAPTGAAVVHVVHTQPVALRDPLERSIMVCLLRLCLLQLWKFCVFFYLHFCLISIAATVVWCSF